MCASDVPSAALKGKLGAVIPGTLPPRGLPLWPLPLVAAALPVIASLWALSLYVDSSGARCNPFIDDCVSISRMARHGMSNQVFRMLVIPGAVLQALTWLVTAWALARVGMGRRSALALAVLGACAGAALVVYASVLGSDGDVYRWMRRRGTIGYFAGTYVAMVIFLLTSLRLHAARHLALPRLHAWALAALLGFIALIGIGHGAGTLRGADTLENLTEWWAALGLTLTFGVMASWWRRWGLVAAIDLRPRGS